MPTRSRFEPRACDRDKEDESSGQDSHAIEKGNMDADLMFGWQLYFGELGPGSLVTDDVELHGDGCEKDDEKKNSACGMIDMEYGWRLYFNELPVLSCAYPCSEEHP
jgi:hypothetical protein